MGAWEAPDSQIVRSRRIVVPGGVIDGYVRIVGGRIAEVGRGDPAIPSGVPGSVVRRTAGGPGERPRGGSPPVVDLGDAWLLPGMIDLHIHGLGGWDTYDLRPEAARSLGLLLAATGTTAYWPTLATAAWAEMEAACAFWGAFIREAWGGPLPAAGPVRPDTGREAAADEPAAAASRPRGAATRAGGDAAGTHPALAAGARPLGLHLEGPFLNPRKPGAMRPDWMVPPDLDRLEALLARAAGTV
ncbi:MAG TPA: hypothetical protein VIL40_00780, partial [Thermaerobacter sp.]